MKPVGAALLLAVCVGSGCTRYMVTDRAPQAHYRTSYPTRDISLDLEQAFRSVKRIQVTARYTTWRFARPDSITKERLRDPATWRRALEQYNTMPTKVGTATVIAVTDRSVTLVTNDHVVRLPDTVAIFYSRETASGRRESSGAIESISIRTSVQYLVLGLPENEGFRVLARDSLQDIAAIAVRIPEGTAQSVPVLPLRTGEPEKLSWGSLVYVLGYPAGFRMVTRGIVSDPNRSSTGAFLIDGLFNRGISGGPILAVRGDSDALEWVGIAASAAATPEYLLMPEQRDLRDDGMLVPYDGPLYMERASRIQYGITFPVPITSVQEFLRRADIPLRVTHTRSSAAL